MSESTTSAAVRAETPAADRAGNRGRVSFAEIEPLMELADMIAPMAVRAAATLRLADHIAAGNTALDQLASAAGVPADPLRRLLRFLIARGVFTETEPDTYGLTELAGPLRGDHPARLRDRFDLHGPVGRGDLAFVHLLDSISTGGSCYERMYGRPFWDHLDSDPDQISRFAAMMAANATQVGIEQHHPWNQLRHVVDVGGGNGTVICQLLGTHPDLRGTVVELPSTAETARKTVAGAGFGDRCEIVPGSFFDPLPAGADVYLLCKVLHDWDDEQSVAILRRCAEAAGARGRVLIVEAAHTGNAKSFSYLDLHMLAYFGGRERTMSDYRELVAAAGLSIRSSAQGGWGTAILECGPREGAA